MYLTKVQKNLVDSKCMVHISFQPILEKEGTIGYAFKDKFYYKIRMDNSIENNEHLSMSILIHELGHIELGHMDESIKESIKYVFEVAEELGIPKNAIRLLNRGVMGIINICMDLEVNDKFLTYQNIKDMTNEGYQPVTTELLKLEPQDHWKDYIRPYLEKIKSQYDELKDIVNDLFMNLKDIGGMQTKRCKCNQNEDEESSDNDSNENESNGGGSNKNNSNEDDSNENDSNEDNGVTQSDMEDDGNDPEEYIEDEKELSELFNGSIDNSIPGSDHTEHESDLRIDQKSPSKMIEDFFMQLLTHERTMMIDSMKHYNRGTRSNDHGLIYTSISRKVRLKPRKLGILIDVSGSMDHKDLLIALDSLEPLLHTLHKDSVIVAWDTDLCEEYSINKLPKSLSEGGGTDMAKGLKYLNKKGFDTIVIYSDFETDRDDLYREAVNFGKDLNFIVVDSNINKDNIIKDQDKLVRRSIKLIK